MGASPPVYPQYSTVYPPPPQYPTAPYYQYPAYAPPGATFYTSPQPPMPPPPQQAIASVSAPPSTAATTPLSATGGGVNQGAWSEEETERLKKLAEESKAVGTSGDIEWDWVVHSWGNGRTRCVLRCSRFSPYVIPDMCFPGIKSSSRPLPWASRRARGGGSNVEGKMIPRSQAPQHHRLLLPLGRSPLTVHLKPPSHPHKTTLRQPLSRPPPCSTSNALLRLLQSPLPRPQACRGRCPRSRSTPRPRLLHPRLLLRVRAVLRMALQVRSRSLVGRVITARVLVPNHSRPVGPHHTILFIKPMGTLRTRGQRTGNETAIPSSRRRVASRPLILDFCWGLALRYLFSFVNAT